MKILKFFIILQLTVLVSCNHTRTNENLVSIDKKIKNKYCVTKICLLDVAYLLESSSEQEFIEPCDDFKEFALGKYKIRSSSSDRYGFSFDSTAFYRDRLIKLLSAKVDKNDTRVTKIAKNFFQKCVDPKYIQSEGRKEFAEYIQHKAYPLVDGGDWWPENVNLSINILDPASRIEHFIFHKLTRCIDPRDSDAQIFCWKFTNEFLQKVVQTNQEKVRQEFFERLNEIDFVIKVDQSLVNKSIEHFMDFFNKVNDFEWPDEKKTPTIMAIKTIMSYITPKSKIAIDWLSLINNEFLEHSKALTDREEVLIDDWKYFSRMMELYESTPSRIVMDVLFLTFLYEFEHVYSDHSFKKEESREQQCFKILDTNFSPALLSLYSQHYLNKLNVKEAEKFAREAIKDVLDELLAAKDLENIVKDDLKRRFNKMKIVLGAIDGMLDNEQMEDVYNELQINDAGILETTIKLINYNNKLSNEPINSWLHQINQLSKLKGLRYFAEKDMLFIPAEYLHYPFFDVNRPRFFNTATLYTEIVVNLNKGVKDFLKSEYKLYYNFKFDSVKLGYKNYIQWEADYKVFEKNLPSFKLTNKQMYWLAYANSYFKRDNGMVLDALNAQFKFSHVWFKSRPEFRAAFGCNDLNENEKQQFENFKEILMKIFQPKM